MLTDLSSQMMRNLHLVAKLQSLAISDVLQILEVLSKDLSSLNQISFNQRSVPVVEHCCATLYSS